MIRSRVERLTVKVEFKLNLYWINNSRDWRCRLEVWIMKEPSDWLLELLTGREGLAVLCVLIRETIHMERILITTGIHRRNDQSGSFT